MGMSYALGRFVCVDLTAIAFLEAHEQTACPLISHCYLLLLEVLPNIDEAKKRLYFDFRSLVNNYLPPKSIILHITSMFYIFRKQRKTEDKEKKRRNCTRKRRWKLLKF